MAWVTLDDNFPNHPKAVAAGPVASYLFVCGLCYCRKFHTDGLIPAKAVKTLGVSTNPARLIAALVAAGLWEQVEAGYRVHDYQSMYPDDAGDKADKDERRQQKRDAGRKGGLKTWGNRGSALAGALAETEQPAEATAKAHRSGEGSDVVVCSSKEETSPPLPRLLLDFTARYPGQGRCATHLTETAFFEVVGMDVRGPSVAYAALCQRLEGHMRSHQWRVKQMIPRLDRYLREGLHLQELPEHPPTSLVSDKTIRTLSSADQFVKEGHGR